MELKLRRFYDQLTQHVDLETDAGRKMNFSTFTTYVSSPEWRKKMYDNLTPYVDLGSYEEYDKGISEALKEVPKTPVKFDPNMGYWSSGLSNFARSFLQTIEHAAEGATKVLSEAGPNPAIMGLPQYEATQAANLELPKMEEKTTEAFPTDPEAYKSLLAGKIPSIGGTITGFALSAALLHGAGVPEALAGGIVGSMSMGAEEYQRALRETGDTNKAIETFAANLPIGATFGIPFAQAVKRINWIMNGEVLNALNVIKMGGIDQAIQMGAVTFMQNAAAKEIYDAERNLSEGVAEGALTGWLSGLALNALAVGAALLREKAPTYGKLPKEEELKEIGYDKESLEYEQKIRDFIENNIGISESGGKEEAEVAIRFLRALSKYTGKPIKDLVEFKKYKPAEGTYLQDLIAKHGSPYVFDKFKIEHVGEGEGANAFGYGLYFTDVKDVAKFYAESVSSSNVTNVTRRRVNEFITKHFGKEFIGDSFLTNDLSEIAKKWHAMKLAGNKDYSLESLIKFELEKKAALNETFSKDYEGKNAVLGDVAKTTAGKMNEILNDPVKMRELTDNIEQIERELNPNIYTVKISSKGDRFKWLDWYEDVPVEDLKMIKNYLAKEFANESSGYKGNYLNNFESFANGDLTISGGSLYNFLRQFFDGSKRETSKFLAQIGYDGIKYPTGTLSKLSTIGGEKGTNYVVFDDNAVKILQRDPLYQEGRGYITFNEEGKGFIDLTKMSDVTTIIHEFAHLARRHLSTEDKKVADEFVEAKPGEPWTVKQEEQFAKAFELWVFEGRTSNPELKGVFQRLRQLFIKIYKEFGSSFLGSEFTPEMEVVFDKIVGGTELMTQKEKLIWARSQIDNSYWLNQIYGSDPEGGASFNYETEQSMIDNGVDPDVTKGRINESGDITYEKPKRISLIAQHLKFPLWVLHNERLKSENPNEPSPAERLSFSIINGQLRLQHIENDLKAWWAKLRPSRLLGIFGTKETKEVELLTRKALELAYKIRDPNVSVASKAAAKEDLAKLYAEHPLLQKAIDGVDGRGGFIELFETIKNDYKKAMRKEYELQLGEKEYGIFTDVVDRGKTVEEAIRRWINVDEMAREAWINSAKKKGISEEKAIADWEKGGKKVERKKDTVLRSLIKHINKSVLKPYEEIDSWGIDDFITNIELGNYMILDPRTKQVISYAKSVGDAKVKARKLRLETQARGEEVGPLIVKPNLSRINPTASREFVVQDETGREIRRFRDLDDAKRFIAKKKGEGKTLYLKHGILKGEENIYDALPSYIHSMYKRIVFRPILAEFDKLKRENPNVFSPEVNKIISDQFDAALGNIYGWVDKFSDEISTSLGLRTGVASSVSRGLRWFTANTKLGYRVFPSIINALTGFRQIYVKTGLEFYIKARDAMTKGIYVDSEGRKINLEDKLAEIENEFSLGLDFAVDSEGNIKTRESLWKPLGMFQRPEVSIRKRAWLANYILLREKYGLSDEEATWQAVMHTWFQQATYNTAAVPKLMRTSTGKLIGQFKSYFINQLHFMASLRGWEIPRFIETELVIGGPRAMLYFIKSFPLLMAFGAIGGWLDDIEKWMLSSDNPAAVAMRGVFGLFGADVTPAVAFQFPKYWEDWLGASVKTVSDLWSKVLAPSVDYALGTVGGKDEKDKPGFIKDKFIDWAKGLSPLFYYWDQFVDTVVLDWDSGTSEAEKKFVKSFQEPNIWVRDSKGNRAYLVNGEWDRALLLMGGAPLALSEYQVKKQILKRAFEQRKENRRDCLQRISKKLVEGKDLDQDDINDLMLYGINPRGIPSAIKWKEMLPEQRELYMQNIMDRLDAIDIIGLK